MVFYHMQCSRVNEYSMLLMPLLFLDSKKGIYYNISHIDQHNGKEGTRYSTFL